MVYFFIDYDRNFAEIGMKVGDLVRWTEYEEIQYTGYYVKKLGIIIKHVGDDWLGDVYIVLDTTGKQTTIRGVTGDMEILDSSNFKERAWKKIPQKN